MKSLQIVGNARYGGATYLMLEWSKFLVEKGVEVDVVCTDPIMINKSKEVPGIRVIDNIYMPREIKPFTDLKAFYQLITLMRRKRYDVVHTYTAVPSFLGRFASRLSGMPVCVNHQGGWSVGEDSSLIERLFFTPLEYAATLACTKNICVSHAEKAKALDLGLAPTHKLVTIVNGIDPQRFVTARQNQNRAAYLAALDVPEDHLIIGNTGRLVPGKGNEELIESIGLLLKRSELNGRPVTLLLAGDGVDRPKIEALIDSLNLKDHIRLLGFWNDVPGLLANIDIFITPTHTEGLSISLLEAMATACSIIATNIPPNAEVIEENWSGLLVPVQAPDEICEAAIRLATEPGLSSRLAQNARQKALAYYSLERMFAETWQLYLDLLGEKTSAISTDQSGITDALSDVNLS